MSAVNGTAEVNRFVGAGTENLADSIYIYMYTVCVYLRSFAEIRIYRFQNNNESHLDGKIHIGSRLNAQAGSNIYLGKSICSICVLKLQS